MAGHAERRPLQPAPDRTAEDSTSVVNLEEGVVIFAKQICGVDGSPMSDAAVGQAARLASAGTGVLLVTVLDPWNPPAGLEGELEDPATQPFDALPAGTAIGHVHLRVASIPTRSRSTATSSASP